MMYKIYNRLLIKNLKMMIQMIIFHKQDKVNLSNLKKILNKIMKNKMNILKTKMNNDEKINLFISFFLYF